MSYPNLRISAPSLGSSISSNNFITTSQCISIFIK